MFFIADKADVYILLLIKISFIDDMYIEHTFSRSFTLSESAVWIADFSINLFFVYFQDNFSF